MLFHNRITCNQRVKTFITISYKKLMADSTNLSGLALNTNALANNSFNISSYLAQTPNSGDSLSLPSFNGRSSSTNTAQDLATPTATPTTPTIQIPGIGASPNPNPNPYLTSAAITPDFNGDGKTDKVWIDQTTGEMRVDLMNGATVTTTATNKNGGTLSAIQLTPTTTAKIGDFNGDGKTDILLRDQSTGTNQLVLMNGASAPTIVKLDSLGSAWNPLIGDFNGDRKTDILWHNTQTGQNAMWLIDTTQSQPVTSSTNLATLAAAFNPTLVDFNGDGKTDILWRNSSTGENTAWFMNGSQATTQTLTTLGSAWTASVADFNGDYKTDILWRNSATGENAVWLANSVLSNNVVFTTANLTTLDSNWQSNIGDFNGDGKTDVLWHNKSTGENTSWLMNGTTIATQTFLPTTSASLTPTFGDFNGDGKTDIYWRDNTSGADQVWTANSGGTTFTTTPVAAKDQKSPVKLDANGKPVLGADGKPTPQWITF